MKQLVLAGALVLAWGLPASAQVVGQLQTITVIDSGTACVTAPTACATYALDSQTGGLAISVAGTWTGTLTFEGTANGSVWTSLLATNLATGASATTTTASGLFTVTNAGVVGVRVRATGAITGAALVTAAKGLGFARAWLLGGTVANPILFPDGASGAPSIAFASETTLGFWRSSAAIVTLQGGLTVTGSMLASGDVRAGSANSLFWTGRSVLQSPANSLVNISNQAVSTVGYQINAGTAAPTATTCGTGTVTAHSNNMAGQITATGATVCTLTFGAPAWTFTPFCTVTEVTAARALFISAASATAITVSGLTSNDVFNYICGGGSI